MDGKPFGYGREYSENDNLVYEGFVFEGRRVCFGKEWNDDVNNNCLVYEGGYWNGEWCGKGKSYDLNRNVDFDGEWMNNNGIIENERGSELINDLIVSMSIEEFVIGDEILNDENITTLHFTPLLIRLKRIEIGSNSFVYYISFQLFNLNSFQSIEFKEYCFAFSNCLIKSRWKREIELL